MKRRDEDNLRTLRDHLRANRISEADALFASLQEAPGSQEQLNTPICNVMLKHLVIDRGDVAGAGEELFSYMKQSRRARPTLQTYNTMIIGWSKKRDVDNVERIQRLVDEMRSSRGIIPDVITYNNLIAVWGRKRQVEKVEHLLEEMKRDGVEPDQVTYSTLIGVWTETNMNGKLHSVLKEMSERNIAPNTYACNWLLLAWTRTGNLNINPISATSETSENNDKSESNEVNSNKIATKSDDISSSLDSVFALMKQYSVPFNIVSYNVLMNAYAKNKDVAKVQFLLKHMREQKIGLNAHSCSILLSMWTKLGHNEKAEEVIDYMKSNKIQMDKFLYNSLIEFYGKIDNLRKVQELLKEMTENKCPPDVATCTMLIRIWADKEDTSYVEKIVEYMVRNQITIDQKVYSILVSMWCMKGDISKVQMLFRQMVEKRVPISIQAFTSLLSFWVHRSDEKNVEKLVQYMNANNVQFDEVVYKLLIEFWYRKDNKLKLLQMFEEARNRVVLRPPTCTTLAMAGVNMDHLIKYMDKNKIEKDEIMRNKMLDHFVKKNDIESFNYNLEKMVEFKQFSTKSCQLDHLKSWIQNGKYTAVDIYVKYLKQANESLQELFSLLQPYYEQTNQEQKWLSVVQYQQSYNPTTANAPPKAAPTTTTTTMTSSIPSKTLSRLSNFYP